MHERDEKCIHFGRKSQRKRLFGRHGYRWGDIRMDVREIGWEIVDWMHLAEDSDQ
jgi:hypothetical protein